MCNVITQGRALVFPTGEGTQTLNAMGVQITFKAASNETGGAYSLLEYHAPAGFPGPPTHLHRAMEEAFYVLEGSMIFTLDGEALQVGAGGFVLVPRGLPHQFAVTEDGPARFLCLISPAGFEEYFVELVAGLEAGTMSYPELEQALEAKYDYFNIPTD